MIIKRLFAMLSAIALIFATSIPIFAETADKTDLSPDGVVTSEDVSELPEQSEQSHTYSTLAIEPPDFTAKIDQSPSSGIHVLGTFTDFRLDTIRVTPMYSLDGDSYQMVDDENNDWTLGPIESPDDETRRKMENQPCVYPSDEPMASYLAMSINEFYVKLKIELEDGTVYYTKPAQIIRENIDIAPETKIAVTFSGHVRASERTNGIVYTYGKYQITAQENSTLQDIYSSLPKTVPLEIHFYLDPKNPTPVKGVAEVEVTWKELSELHLTLGETSIIRDAAQELTIPQGTVVHTPQGYITLQKSLAFDNVDSLDEIRIHINVIGNDKIPFVSLIGNEYEEGADDYDTMKLAFSLKPSGATSIKAYSFVAEDDNWTELSDLMDSMDVNARPNVAQSGFITIMSPDNPTYHAYLQGEIPGFMVGLSIKGGVYDGDTVTLPWPGAYNPPPNIPDISGSGGNENNAGSGDGSTDGSSGNGGQRPTLPQEKSNPPKGNGDAFISTSPLEDPTLPVSGGKTDGSNSPEISTLQKSNQNRGTIATEIETQPGGNETPVEPQGSSSESSGTFSGDTPNTLLPIELDLPEAEQLIETSNNRPVRTSKGVPTLPIAAAGLLLTGGVAAVTMKMDLETSIRIIGAFSKLIATIKHLFIHTS